MELEPLWEDRGGGPDFEKEYWDEDDWERFMIQQDRKTDELMKLREFFEVSGVEERDFELQDFPADFDIDDHDSVPPGEAFTYHNILAYRLSFDFAVKAMKFLQSLTKEEFAADQNFDNLAAHCGTASAKIAGGDGIGYSAQSICGNIVNCKRAAEALRLSIEALEGLADGKFAEEIACMESMAEVARQEVLVRIAELRLEARILHGAADY